jgi:hypothetical protein
VHKRLCRAATDIDQSADARPGLLVKWKKEACAALPTVREEVGSFANENEEKSSCEAGIGSLGIHDAMPV